MPLNPCAPPTTARFKRDAAAAAGHAGRRGQRHQTGRLSAPARHDARRSAGFSLIEVLVAIGMVSVALVAGLAASMSLTRHAERQPEVLLAQLCAQNTLAGLRLARQLPESGERHYPCSQAGRDFSVRLNVEATAHPDFRQVRAEVLPIGQPGTGNNPPTTQVLLSLSTVMGRY